MKDTDLSMLAIRLVPDAVIFADNEDHVADLRRRAVKELQKLFDGHQLVPVEPTRPMWAAMGDALVGYRQRHHDKVAGDLWQAVLRAAP